VFRIATVDNSASGASDVVFDPELLYVNEEPRPYAKGYYTLGWKNPRAVEKRTVKAGTSEVFNGTVAVEVQASGAKGNGAEVAKNNSYFLLYDTPAGAQGVAATRTNASQTSWEYTNDCAAIEGFYPNP
jgi:hypothetical protein